MEDRADQNVERRPRQVADRNQPVARDEAPDGIEVPDDLKAVCVGAGDRGVMNAVEDAVPDQFVEGVAHALQEAAARGVDRGLQQEQHQRDREQADQRRQAAARQHPVVGLEHEDRSDQHQEIDEEAGGSRREECGTGFPRGALQLDRQAGEAKAGDGRGGFHRCDAR